MNLWDRFCEAMFGGLEGRAANRCIAAVFIIAGIWLGASVAAMAFGAH